MSKYGTLLVPSNISLDEFDGDGSTTQFTLVNGANLASDNAYVVTVNGMEQDDWTRSGLVFTFTTAPPTGTDNVRIRTFGQRLDINTPNDGAVGTTQLADGAVTEVKMTLGAMSPWKVVANETISSNVVALEMDDIFSDNYAMYQVHLFDLLPVSDQAIPYLRLGNGSTYNSGASDYDWNLIMAATSSFDALDSTINLADAVSNVAGEGLSGYINIHKPADSSIKTRMTWQVSRQASTSIGNGVGCGQRNAAEANTSLRLSYQTDDTAGGQVIVYGLDTGSVS